jgi:hypothetical protein
MFEMSLIINLELANLAVAAAVSEHTKPAHGYLLASQTAWISTAAFTPSRPALVATRVRLTLAIAYPPWRSAIARTSKLVLHSQRGRLSRSSLTSSPPITEHFG